MFNTASFALFRAVSPAKPAGTWTLNLYNIHKYSGNAVINSIVTGNKPDYLLVGLGEVLWDLLPGGKQLGGAPANFAYQAQSLGGQAAVVSCVGSDELGREVLRRLDDLGLDRRYVAVDRDHPTGTVTVGLDADGQPDYAIHEETAWDYIPFGPGLQALADRADAVCFGSLCQRGELSRQTVHQFLVATNPDCLRVFDINLRQAYFDRESIHALLERSNVFKLNGEELPVVAQLLRIGGSETDILAQLVERYALRLIALTRARAGSRLYGAGEDSAHRGYPADVADTVGAGDSFAAALTLGLLRGHPLDRINEHANRVASFVCSQRGAMPGLPTALVQAG